MGLYYRKKPVVIQAFQMTEERRRDNRDWPNWLNKAWNEENTTPGAVYPSKYPNSDGTDELEIVTLEGVHRVNFGDWIARGIRGELYPIKDEIFQATYDAVADEEAEQEVLKPNADMANW